MKQRIHALQSAPMLAALALEEKIWNTALRLTDGLMTRPRLVALTRRARQMPVTEALCALLLPILAFLPLKAAALMLVFSGDWLAGLLGLIAGNILGVGVLARIYTTVEPVLLTVPALAQARADFLEWRGKSRPGLAERTAVPAEAVSDNWHGAPQEPLRETAK